MIAKSFKKSKSPHRDPRHGIGNVILSWPRAGVCLLLVRGIDEVDVPTFILRDGLQFGQGCTFIK